MSLWARLKRAAGITDQTAKRGHAEAMAASDQAIARSREVTAELRRPLPSLRPQLDSIVEWLDDLEHRA